MAARVLRFVVATLYLAAIPAEAQVYKCVDTDGNLTFSQVPCPGEKSTTVNTGARSKSDADCRWATKFANDIARRMRAGRSSEATFSVYGGVDAVNSGTLNLINYVYRYEHADDVPTERIASLTGSMCKAGSLGNVSCETLPFPDDEIDRCESGGPEEFEERRAEAAGIPLQTVQGANIEPSAASRTTTSGPANSKAVLDCKQPIRDQIDEIYDAMREGYDSAQGERYRARLRVLSRDYRECEQH